MTKAATFELGIAAEKRAARYLQKRGYSLLEERYKTPVGEIDLLMRDGDTLVAVEVKARKTLTDALEAITPRNRQRVQNALLFFLSQNPEYAHYGLRFDVVACCGAFSLQHLDNAWEASS